MTPESSVVLDQKVTGSHSHRRQSAALLRTGVDYDRYLQLTFDVLRANTAKRTARMFATGHQGAENDARLRTSGCCVASDGILHT